MLCTQDTDCNDNNPCTDDSCDLLSGACAYNNNTNPCDDGLLCTDGDTCAGGRCGGAQRDCSAAGDQCNQGVCNTSTGACEPRPVADTVSCDDHNRCTPQDTCTAGVCVGSGPPPTCDDGNECTADSCDSTAGCVNDPTPRNGFACDDESFCTQRDACSDGICRGVQTGADSDGDGYCDFQEVQAGCNAHDPAEVPPQPVFWAGLPGEGNVVANGLLTYASPAGNRRARIKTSTDPSCVTSGICGPHGFCKAGRVGDPCGSNAACDLPANTCRVVVNFGMVPDLNVDARLNRTSLAGFSPVSPGCARKVDIPLDTSVRLSNRLILRATGTIGGRLARDRDRIRYQR
jgi:hypothetical protein